MTATTQLWWHVARAGGLVSWALVAASVIWGLMLSTKTRPKNRRPHWVLDLHRFLGGLSVVFALIHIAGLMLDSYIGFGPTQVLVPFTSTYRPGAVALGVVAMYLLVAIEVTSLMRRHLTRRTWKLVHMSSFALFGLGSAHTIWAGTDAGIGWIEYTIFITTAIVAGLTIVRIDQARRSPIGARAHRTRPTPNTSPTPRAPLPVGVGHIGPRRTDDRGSARLEQPAVALPRTNRRPPLTTSGASRPFAVDRRSTGTTGARSAVE